MSDPKTTPVARMEAEGRNPGDGGETGAPDSAALHPGYGAEFEWQEVKISDLAGAYAGGTPSRTISRYFGGPIPWVKSSELNRPVIDGTEETLSEEGFSSSSARWIPARTPLIAMYGATAGRISWLKIKATSNQAVLALAPEPHQCDSRWLYWVLMANTEKLISSSIQGSGQPNLNKSVIERFTVHAPLDMHEQHRIAEILDTLDDAIQKTEQLIAKLKQIKQGLLHDLLTRGIDENGQLRDPIAHPEQFKDSVVGRIPVAWEVVQIKDIGKVFGGKRLPTGHSYSDEPTGYTYLRVLDFFEKTVDPKTLMFLPPETFAALERHEIHNGNLYISIAGSIGYVGVFEASDNVRTVLTENAARIDLTEDIYPPFVAYQMNGYEVQRQIDIEKGTGGGVPKLALFRIENLWIAKPPISEQKAIAQRLLQHEQTLGSEKKYLGKLKFLKKGLMNDLLTGKVRAPGSRGIEK